jgi:hypothetical protein
MFFYVRDGAGEDGQAVCLCLSELYAMEMWKLNFISFHFELVLRACFTLLK